MVIRMDAEQLEQLRIRWKSLLRQLEELLSAMDHCTDDTMSADLPSIVGLLAGIENSREDLFRLRDRIERICEYLDRCAQTMQEAAEGPAGGGQFSQTKAMRVCPTCGFRQDASLPFCFNCAWPMDRTSAVKPASRDSWDDDPWGSDITVSDGPAISLDSSGSMASGGSHGEFDAAPPPDDDIFIGDDIAGCSGDVPEKNARTRREHSLSPMAHTSDLSRILEQVNGSEEPAPSGVCICPTCGSAMPAHMRFCRFCGNPLPEEAPSPPQLTKVQFSAVAPQRFERGKRTMVDIFMYEDSWRHVIERRIRTMEQDAQETGSGYREVPDRAKVRIVLTSPDVDIPDGDQSAPWSGRYLQFSYAVRVPDGFKGRDFVLNAAVFVNEVPLTRLTWTMRRDTAAHKLGLWAKKRREAQAPQTLRSDIRSAFVSYCSDDLEQVTAIIQGIRAVRPDLDIFFDVDSLHSGEKWKHTLEKEIPSRDVLFLCWSQSAKDSEWVNYEWNLALEHKGLDAIQPIPLELPSLCPPPEKLDGLHFNDKYLYYRKFSQANT